MQFEFEKLEIYQKAMEFINKIYEETKNFPKTEQFGLTSQLRRAAVSISLNIAEGYGRYHKKEKIQFYRMARASVHECIPALSVSLKQGYLEKKEYEKMYGDCHELSRMIAGLSNAVGRRDEG